ncbi:MAG: O-antigen ligase family protein [Vicinamibacterales bacterium]
MSSRRHLFNPAALLLLAWSALAFGGQYVWVYVPALVFSVAVSVLGFIAARHAPHGAWRSYRPLILALVVIWLAAAVQVVPMPPKVVERLSPARNNANYTRLYAEATFTADDLPQEAPPATTLSIAPSRTWLAMTFLTCLGLLLVASARGFTAVRPTGVARGIMIIGVVAAFACLGQIAAGTDVMYGLMRHRQVYSSVMPFINANHTAGFLVMTLAVTLGFVASSLSKGWTAQGESWRRRWLWLGEQGGLPVVLGAFAAVLIASTVLATRSRSGLLSLGVVLLLFLLMLVRQRLSLVLRTAVVVVLVGGALLIASVGQIERTVERFTPEQVDSVGGRTQLWSVAMREVRDFTLTGTGLNTYGIAALHYQPPGMDAIYIEAHNDYLQLAAEGGVLLGIPIVAAVLVLAGLIFKRFRAAEDDLRLYWLRVGATIGLCAIAFQSVFDYTLQMPGAAILFVLLCAMAIHRPWLVAKA